MIASDASLWHRILETVQVEQATIPIDEVAREAIPDSVDVDEIGIYAPCV